MSIEDTGAEATISDEELLVDLTPDGTETLEELSQKLANAEKAKKQILARARKAEAEAKALKEAPPITKKEGEPSDDDKLWEVAELIREGFTRQDVDFIKANGGRAALNDSNSYVSIAMSRIKEQREAEQASSQTSQGTGASEIERKYTPEQLRNMTPSELERLLPHAEG